MIMYELWIKYWLCVFNVCCVFEYYFMLLWGVLVGFVGVLVMIVFCECIVLL